MLKDRHEGRIKQLHRGVLLLSSLKKWLEAEKEKVNIIEEVFFSCKKSSILGS
jgi:Holliday junction resolvasome RuvABC endonuclease subunit